MTIKNRINRLQKYDDPDAEKDIARLEELADQVEQITPEQFPNTRNCFRLFGIKITAMDGPEKTKRTGLSFSRNGLKLCISCMSI